MKAKYINPFTDFGFKKIFGEEVYRDLKGVIDTAFDEGKLKVAKNLKKKA